MGKGGFFRVRELTLQLESVREKNEESRLRNAKLASEVHNLETGTEAIEERARYELGMIKRDEIFIRIIDPSKFPEKNKPIEGSITAPDSNKTQASSADTKTASKETSTGEPPDTQKPADPQKTAQ